MKKKKKKLLEIISVIFIISIVGALFWTFFSSRESPQACTEEARICSDGTAVSRVEPDCNFEVCPNVEENRNFCTPEQRGGVCISIHEPVCGFYDYTNTKSTFSNSCLACSDQEVLFWIIGVCN